MIAAILEFLFIYNRDGVYVHGAPSLVELLKQHEDKVKLEYLPSNCIRAWTLEGYQKYVLTKSPRQQIEELTKQLELAMDKADIAEILKVRKQIKELGIK